MIRKDRQEIETESIESDRHHASDVTEIEETEGGIDLVQEIEVCGFFVIYLFQFILSRATPIHFLVPRGAQSIYIGNLPYDVRREEVRVLCEKYGEVYSVTIGARGYGFVAMDERGAHEAVRDLHGRTFGGRTLHLNVAYNERRR